MMIQTKIQVMLLLLTMMMMMIKMMTMMKYEAHSIARDGFFAKVGATGAEENEKMEKLSAAARGTCPLSLASSSASASSTKSAP